MQNTLHRLVYYSRNRVEGSDRVIGLEIRTILASSQRNNQPIGITGALMFNAGCFAQVLEGGRVAIETTFERIQQDTRHGEVSLLAFEPIEQRSYGHWSMGFVGASPDHAAAFADISSSSGFDPSRASGDQILKTLATLALEDESAAA